MEPDPVIQQDDHPAFSSISYEMGAEQVPGIEPRSSDWKSEVITVIRYLQVVTTPLGFVSSHLRE